MLKSLRIQNFRVFQDLTIDRLAPVNLIVGRNNIGKTTLLEALNLYYSPNVFQNACDLLTQRHEFSPQDSSLMVSWQNLFHQPQDQVARLQISEDLAAEEDPILHPSTLSIVPKWMWKESRAEAGETHVIQQQFGEEPPLDADAIEVLVAYQGGDIIGYTDVRSRSDWGMPYKVHRAIQDRSAKLHCLLLPFGSKAVVGVDVAKLWDDAVLSDQEDRVLALLRLVEPQLNKVRIIQDQTSGKRLVFVKIADQKPVPLNRLGDGIARLFELAVSLVNLEAGATLLVDEFDAGVHYSVLTDVWCTILETAQTLGVQVFATTHSWDCIQAFQEA
ncbi:MAG: AAA family ATPase, partial [Prochlorothrix sp.]